MVEHERHFDTARADLKERTTGHEAYTVDQTDKIMRVVKNDTAMSLLAAVHTATALPLSDMTSRIESLRELKDSSVTAPQGWMALADLHRAGLVGFVGSPRQESDASAGYVWEEGVTEFLIENLSVSHEAASENAVRGLVAARQRGRHPEMTIEEERIRNESRTLFANEQYILHRMVKDHSAEPAPLSYLDEQLVAPHGWLLLARIYKADFISYDADNNLVSPTERGKQFYKKICEALDFSASDTDNH